MNIFFSLPPDYPQLVVKIGSFQVFQGLALVLITTPPCFVCLEHIPLETPANFSQAELGALPSYLFLSLPV